MSGNNIKYVDLLPKYLVVESLHPNKFGISKVTINGASIGGAAINQVYRQVAQVAVETAYYQQGERVTGLPSPWQMIKDFTGYAEFEKRIVGNRSYMLVYAGAKNSIETFGVEFGFPMDSISYGTDPIPRVRLAGNAGVTFSASNGGKGPMRATALYDGDTGQLAVVPPARADEMIRSFMKSKRTSNSK